MSAADIESNILRFFLHLYLTQTLRMWPFGFVCLLQTQFTSAVCTLMIFMFLLISCTMAFPFLGYSIKSATANKERVHHAIRELSSVLFSKPPPQAEKHHPPIDSTAEMADADIVQLLSQLYSDTGDLSKGELPSHLEATRDAFEWVPDNDKTPTSSAISSGSESGEQEKLLLCPLVGFQLKDCMDSHFKSQPETRSVVVRQSNASKPSSYLFGGAMGRWTD